MPRNRWKPREEMTPFARLVWDWMTAQGPGMTMAEVARRVGISQQSVGDWFYRDAVPRKRLLPRISDGLGIPLDDLKEASGHTDEQDDVIPPDAAEVVKHWREISEQAREKILGIVREERTGYHPEVAGDARRVAC